MRPSACGLQIDHRLIAVWPFDRHVTRLGAVEYFVDHGYRTREIGLQVGAVGYETADLGDGLEKRDRRELEFKGRAAN